MAASEPRAERTIGGAFCYLVRDHRIGVLILDAVLNAVPVEKIGQHMFRKVRLSLVEVAGQEIDRQKTAPLQIEQCRQQSKGILSARKRDQPSVAWPDHRKVFHRLPGQSKQALAELVELDRRWGIQK